ncbi:hypothetical protein BDW22DRAFT_319418 [Trametopsis cervina]|nr:hypothetical protein BDW22DRAFT_319418 [Trametopsis cervina]
MQTDIAQLIASNLETRYVPARRGVLVRTSPFAHSFTPMITFTAGGYLGINIEDLVSRDEGFLALDNSSATVPEITRPQIILEFNVRLPIYLTPTCCANSPLSRVRAVAADGPAITKTLHPQQDVNKNHDAVQARVRRSCTCYADLPQGQSQMPVAIWRRHRPCRAALRSLSSRAHPCHSRRAGLAPSAGMEQNCGPWAVGVRAVVLLSRGANTIRSSRVGAIHVCMRNLAASVPSLTTAASVIIRIAFYPLRLVPVCVMQSAVVPLRSIVHLTCPTKTPPFDDHMNK